MLVLSRKLGERIRIGDDIVLPVVSVSGGRARIGIDAPAKHRILREEVRQAMPRITAQGGAAGELSSRPRIGVIAARA